MIKCLSPHARVPSRKAITNMISDMFQRKKDLVKLHLTTINYVSFTCDIWTDTFNSRSYLGLTCHYIDDYHPQSICLAVKHMNESHSADHIAAIIREVMADYEISGDKVVTIVTDGAANMVNAANQISKSIWCVAHRLNLLVNDAIRGNKDVDNLIASVRSIVTFSKQSNNFADAIEKEQLRDNPRSLKLIQDVPTRWNSAYLMLDRFLAIRNYVKMALVKVHKEDMDISYEAVDLLNDIRDLLKPFYQMTNDVSGENYVTISRIIPVVNNLSYVLSMVKVTSLTGLDLKKQLENGIEKRFGSIERVQLLAFATILDPRFKKVDFAAPSACSSAIVSINNLLSDVPLTQSIETEGDSDPLWVLHAKRCQQLVDNHGALASGFKHYLSSPTLELNGDPLDFWRKNKESNHALHNLALKHLSPPATSVPCERLFSKSGTIINEKKSRLKPKNVEMLCFLYSLPNCFKD
ncbi:zinc finger BED domain-containing protein 4-like [Panonychus citri]|uniref:zinc finger BED domain-containing protein 4-like n=1 Tax=Panonychus citri TaxID=50023 RepID=UPI002308186A|nr:zinc finger BED domain-containing protein 4-like [Panonychus citri]